MIGLKAKKLWYEDLVGFFIKKMSVASVQWRQFRKLSLFIDPLDVVESPFFLSRNKRWIQDSLSSFFQSYRFWIKAIIVLFLSLQDLNYFSIAIEYFNVL